MSLADQVRRKKHRAAVKSVLATLVAMSVCVLLPMPGSIFLGIFVGMAIYYWMIRTDRYVIWLRRFHRRAPKRLRFDKLLNSACPGLCIPVTIQDSVFKLSYVSIKLQLKILWELFTVVLTSYFIFAFFVGCGLIELGLSGDNHTIASLIACVPVILLIPVIIEKFSGYVAVSPTNAIEEADYTLTQLPRRKLGFRGVMIFKCPDAVWQRVVAYVIARASAVIIDVSDLTENVLWELKTSLQSHHIESLMLTLGVPEGSREELLPSVRNTLEKTVGHDNVSRLRVFYYPASEPHMSRSVKAVYADLSNRLAAELAARIENTSAYVKSDDVQQQYGTDKARLSVSDKAAVRKNFARWVIFFSIGIFVCFWTGLCVSSLLEIYTHLR